VSAYHHRVGKTLVTGATGFIGSHVARALAGRGDELRLLTRRKSQIDLLADLEFERAIGDVTDRRAVRRAMADVERVFHVAGRTSLRSQDRQAVWDTNVRGTRIVLESALDAEVERVVLTSSVAAIGVGKKPKPVDETATFDIGHLGITYVNSKHEAEVEALRLAARGLPVTIVNPSFVLGPDAPRGSSMSLVKRFIRRQIPVYVDGGLNIVDVRDVARGHLLADKKGEIGKRYILSGRNFTFDRLFADLARISGVDSPRLKLPGPALLHMLEVGDRLPLPVPMPTSPDEVRSAMLWWCYRNTRAKSDLGFKARPHEETLQDAVNWQRAQIAGGRDS
jgi:dihydroflavonol-4-reductase